MDLIDRQQALDILDDYSKDVIEIWHGSYETARRKMCELPSVQPEPQWHECFEDDPNSFPDDDRLVLMSFSNFPTPAVGWFERDEEGGYWTDGEQKTLAELGLFVDGWWELPKKPERN